LMWWGCFFCALYPAEPTTPRRNPPEVDGRQSSDGTTRTPSLTTESNASPTSSSAHGSSGGPPSPRRATETPRSDAYLPPEPPGVCDPRIQAKIKKFHDMKAAGTSINDNLRNSKAFKNPDILEKLVCYCNIIEIASNYPTQLFDPFSYREEDFYDSIAAEQRRIEEKREAERMGRTHIDFTPAQSSRAAVSIAVPVQVITAAPSHKKDDSKSDDSSSHKKRSKWDMAAPTVAKPSAPAVVDAATGNAYAEYVKQRKKREAELTKSQTEPQKKQKQ